MQAPYQRILLIGCGGSGKSTLARRLGIATGLPVVHLDQLFWQPGWQESSREEFDAALSQWLQRDRWIIDGNYDRTLPKRLQRCDAVIWLDFPRRTCLCGVIRRVLGSRGKTRADMAVGCPERFDAKFMKWIWNFNRDHREKYRAMLAGTDAAVFVLHHRREIEPLLQSLSHCGKS